jgi:hypothetical protein
MNVKDQMIENAAIREEPGPEENERVPVHDTLYGVLKELALEKQTITRATHGVADDLMLRKQKGFETYGCPLQAKNGRNALVDAYQEMLDAACYLMQALEEGDEDDWEEDKLMALDVMLGEVLNSCITLKTWGAV